MLLGALGIKPVSHLPLHLDQGCQLSLAPNNNCSATCPQVCLPSQLCSCTAGVRTGRYKGEGQFGRALSAQLTSLLLPLCPF